MARSLLTPNTFPTTDSSVSNIEVEFKDTIIYLIDRVAPQLSDASVKEFIDSTWESFKDYVHIASYEEVRKNKQV